MKRLDHQRDNVKNVVAACVVLHNICESMGDVCPEEWIDTSGEIDGPEVASVRQIQLSACRSCA